MRVYCEPFEAVREVERDLKEMGLRVKSTTVQDKKVDTTTIEVLGYGLQISPSRPLTNGDFFKAIRYRTPAKATDNLEEYFIHEFSNRVQEPDGKEWTCWNPGTAAAFRPSMWDQYRKPDGMFHYTYSQRMRAQWPKIWENLSIEGSRHAIFHFFDGIHVANDHVDAAIGYDAQRTGGLGRVPCSMFYQFLRRGDKLHMVYAMRSCDFINHFAIDMCMALAIQAYIADHMELTVASFTMTIGSLHMFEDDLMKATF